MPKILGKTLIGDSNISFVDAALISVPNTTILNRAQIRNLAADMGPRMGVDRIIASQAFEIMNEFGANGERVFAAMNDDRGLIRYVGNWTSQVSNEGPLMVNLSTTDYVEIAFYGTGLNILMNLGVASLDLRPTVDGGAEGANIFGGASYNSVMAGRSYSTNQIFPVVSGLSAGLHTVKLRNNQTSQNTKVYGFEILNESTTIRVNAGTLIKDQRRFGLDTTQTIAAKPAAYAGTRGARVIMYNSGGQIAQAFTNVNASSAFLTSADHANEDLVRRYYFREFGAGRSDDFSLVNSGNAAFALEDGITNLWGNGIATDTNVVTDSTGLLINNGSFLEFYFIGTGLDVLLRSDTSTGGARSFSAVSIDGAASIGSISITGPARTWTKIASGLPYGTHVVRFTNSSGQNSAAIMHFAVYQPKKPTLPVGALELADYNVMADYVANATAGVDNIATGVMRRNTMREAVYSGSGWASAFQTNGTRTGGQLANQSGSSGGYAEYTFFGTGFEHRGQSNTAYTSNMSLTLNGTALTSANFATASSSSYGGHSFNLSTGVLTQAVNNTNGSGFRVSGLPLAKYTLRMTNNTTSEFQNEAFDIITPIHSPKSMLPGDFQNTMPVGNCSLSDSRQLIRADFGQNKIRTFAQGVVSSPTTSSTVYIPAPDMSVMVQSRGGWFDLAYSLAGLAPAGGNIYALLHVDGNPVGQEKLNGGGSSFFLVLSDKFPVYLTAGMHKIDVYWKMDAGTGTLSSTRRNMSVEEL